MGDRSTPMKFGPEWLRNLAPGTSGSGGINHNTAMPSSPTASASGGQSGGATPTSSNAPNTSTNHSSKVLLAKLRYGREEMLALYDRNSEAPPELKFIELLYQPRGKPPFALNNTFEDEMRENMRSGSQMVTASLGERLNLGRGMGRGLSVIEGRGRARMPFVRQPSTGRGSSMWHHSSPRMPAFSGGGDDDSSLNLRSSWTGSNGGNAPNRNTGEQAEWTPSKMFRSKRQGQATNWRQAREEGEEWRSPDGGRSRERDWGDRPTQDKPQSWSTNRRTWVGGDTQNDDNLPEWAVDNAEACGGTFDSSGAFHGYSSDDTSLPKNQDTAHPLTRSHTHGSFARSKTVEEGSEEWWASEKAKKLSPKRFDASDVKFKKQTSVPEPSVISSDSTSGPANEDQIQDSWTNLDALSIQAFPETQDNASGGLSDDEKFKNFKPNQMKFSESNFDALLRCALHIDDTTDDRRNYQSVMITPNNSLRQKHQNIVAAPDDLPVKDTNCCKPGILQLIQSTGNQSTDNEMRKHQSPEEKIVDGILDMRLEEKDILAKHPKTMSSPLTPPLPNSPMQMRLSSPVYANPGLINAKPNVPTSMQSGLPAGLQGLPAGLQGMPTGLQGLPAGLQMSGMPPTLQVAGMQPLPMQGGMQPSGIQGGGNQGQGMQGNQLPSGMQQSGLQGSGMQPGMQPGMQSMQSVGITNCSLNASLGLPIRPIPNPLGLPIQGVPAPVMPNAGMGGGNLQGGMGGGQMQPGGGGIPPYPNATGIPGLTSANSSLFMSQNPNNPAVGTQGDIPMPNQHGQSNIFPMHGLQHSASQAAFGSSIYSNIMQQTQTQPPLAPQNAGEMWYYEDPTQNIQGPFSSREMYNWYRAGFFSPSLMVRRACENHLHPLGSYGPVVPFAQLDMMPSFPMSSGFERSPGQHESMLNSQPGLGLDSVDSLWGQPSPSADLLWMQQAMSRNDARVNNLPMYFWDQQPSAIASNALLPEEIAKEMKTEDQILAQLRASQKVGAPVVPDAASAPTPAPAKLDEFAAPAGATPDMGELHKLIQKDTLAAKPVPEPESAEPQVQTKPEKIAKPEPKNETDNAKAQQQQQQQQQQQHQQQQQQQTKPAPETKQAKQAKNETEKSKNKENSTAKSKNKKKEEKKEDLESKPKEEELIKSEKRSNEPSPAKSKKEDKTNKKELEKEKKEWLKEGFTIVKGSEKSTNKDNKKKAEEAKAVEEAERKRKEEEKLVAEEDKKRKQAEASVRKQQETQQQQQRQAAESVVKKAPWSAVTNQGMFATSKDGLTLTEIQRLEREKKLEQIKEQQQMMQIIAQQQAAALAREQEMQAGLGWAKKKGNNANAPGQSLAEIQAEARKQAQAAAAAVAAAAAAQALEEAALPPTNHVPWGNAPNGGGFWDTQPNQPSKTVDKPQESPKVAPEPKKKKPTVNVNTTAVKKETSPAVEFESWCTTVLASWSSKIDVPTFVGFLKDIESPYEVKDYVKCYLGESKDSNDFSRQFLERRSKLLRVGMVTPSDDLCSPAMAVNPRTTSTSDYQEVKGKGKKTKKNKMLKVDARILGFSVTASEDRINVGDIDTV